MAILADVAPYEDASEAERQHLLIEAFKRAFADRAQWPDAASLPADRLREAHLRRLMADYRPDAHTTAEQLGVPARLPPENPAATTFITVDREGSAVACALTMNNVFGIGRIARGTGIVLSAVPGQYGGGPASLGPVLMVNPFNHRLFLAAGATGGSIAPTSLVQVLLGLLVEDKPLEDVMLRRRVHHGGRPDLAYFEQGLDDAKIRALTGRGHRLAATPALGLVNAVYCKVGLPYEQQSTVDICAMRADPRGAGIAMSAD
jgi:gamma-glutamyltranspeptidase/glutathione hydrolase